MSDITKVFWWGIEHLVINGSHLQFGVYLWHTGATITNSIYEYGSYYHCKTLLRTHKTVWNKHITGLDRNKTNNTCPITQIMSWLPCQMKYQTPDLVFFAPRSYININCIQRSSPNHIKLHTDDFGRWSILYRFNYVNKQHKAVQNILLPSCVPRLFRSISSVLFDGMHIFPNNVRSMVS